MSVKSKVLATAAALALVGGVGMAGVLGTATAANAATPWCGATCVDIFTHQFGQHGSPNYVLDVSPTLDTFLPFGFIGQPVILSRASNRDPSEDFRLEHQQTVADFYAAGVVSAAFAQHYGCIPGVDFASCYGADITVNDPAFEIEYTPDGLPTGLCVGVARPAVQEEGVILQWCGSADTVWAADQFDAPLTFFTGYVPLINGSSDTDFVQPFVLTYPAGAYPTNEPRPQLQVDNVTGFSVGFPPGLEPGTTDDNQLWGADFGDHF